VKVVGKCHLQQEIPTSLYPLTLSLVVPLTMC
jgi:hypothetical protein